MFRPIFAISLALAFLMSCGSTGEPVDALRDLPRHDRIEFVEDRPTVRVVPCELPAGVLELFPAGKAGDSAELCRAAVERALGESGYFRVRGDSDAVYDLRLEAWEISGGSTATVRIVGALWDTAANEAIAPGIDVQGAERSGDMARPCDLLDLCSLFRDEAPAHRVNAAQKALWKLVAKAQDQLR